MTETEKMQQLHHRASLGETLTADENGVLQSWYDELDREEELMLNRTSEVENQIDWRKQYNATITEIAQSAANVERIAKQNEALRRENQKLREIVEKRLPKLAA
jgi:hypothetical protein